MWLKKQYEIRNEIESVYLNGYQAIKSIKVMNEKDVAKCLDGKCVLKMAVKCGRN